MRVFLITGWFVSVICSCATMATAGDGNKVFLLQESGGGSGNNLVIDQSNASNSIVAGDELGLDPAEQIGGGNSAEITLEGENSTVLFSQNSAGTGGLLGNTALVSGNALATIVLDQNGSGNFGEINVSGQGGTGVLRQTGNDNEGSVFVTGEQALGELNQIGDGNSFTVRVEGDNTTAIYTQVGDNLTTPSGVGASVFSNAGGTVIINQITSQ